MNLKITANHPKNEVKDIIRLAEKFVFGNAVFQLPEDFKVWVKNCKYHAHAGMFYGHKVSMRIGSASKFPLTYQYPNLKTAPRYTMEDWQEGLFVLAVHEFWHYYQMKTHSPYSEIETERRSFRGLEEFRVKRMELNERWKAVRDKVSVRETSQKPKSDYKKSPEYELEQLNKKIAIFLRRLRLYITKIKKLERRKRFLSKRISMVPSSSSG